MPATKDSQIHLTTQPFDVHDCKDRPWRICSMTIPARSYIPDVSIKIDRDMSDADLYDDDTFVEGIMQALRGIGYQGRKFGRAELGMQGNSTVVLEPNDEFDRFVEAKGWVDIGKIRLRESIKEHQARCPEINQFVGHYAPEHTVFFAIDKELSETEFQCSAYQLRNARIENITADLCNILKLAEMSEACVGFNSDPENMKIAVNVPSIKDVETHFAKKLMKTINAALKYTGRPSVYVVEVALDHLKEDQEELARETA